MDEHPWLIVIAVLVLAALFFAVTPTGRETWNNWFFDVQKVDDRTNYATMKSVEDKCRAMMANYTKDKLTYEQYANAESKEQRSWSDQAKMSANATAATYNEYVKKNRFVWQDNIPPDIDLELPYLR